MNPRVTIGSEVQAFRSAAHLTGIQRVITSVHAGLTDRLTPEGVDLVPLHTRIDETPADPGPHVSQDPVMQRRVHVPQEVDAVMLLDVNARANLTSLHHSKTGWPRPVIALVYDIIPLLHAHRFPREGVLQFRLFLQQVLGLADHVVVTSDKVKDDLTALGWRLPRNIHVIRLGTPFHARPPRPVDDDRLALAYVSTLQPYKGHEGLLDAFDLLRSRVHDVSLTLVGGTGVSSEGLEARIRAHRDFGGRLIWQRNVSDLSLAWALQQCSVGVIPSEDEGFGLFLEEGLSLGLKMVVNDIPVFRERPYENVTYSGTTPEDLADAILDAHRKPWHSPVSPVRSMTDFTNDLADLVLSIVRRDSTRNGRGVLAGGGDVAGQGRWRLHGAP